jgi:hypothetical protein
MLNTLNMPGRSRNLTSRSHLPDSSTLFLSPPLYIPILRERSAPENREEAR